MSDRFTKEERSQFYDAINSLDPNQQVVIADKASDCLQYAICIDSKRKVSGRPGDEELTRAVIIAKLVADYGYDASRIHLETSINTGGHNTKPVGPRTDIVIHNDKGKSVQFLCEIKRIHQFRKEKAKSIKDQLFLPYETTQYYQPAEYLFYLSLEVPTKANPFPIKCIGISTQKTPTHAQWMKAGSPTHFLDLFPVGSSPKPEPSFVKLLPNSSSPSSNQRDLKANFSINDLRKRWRNIWEAVWGGTLEDNKYFENFNKVLLAKIYDERKTTTNEAYTFQRKWVAGKQQSSTELASDIDQLYRMAFREYLSTDKNLSLHEIPGIDLKEFPASLVSTCVEELVDLSFTNRRYKNIDILGEFYEMVIRESFKQTKGLYLTHPNIVMFILALLEVEEVVKDRLISPPEDARFRLPFVVDPSCGSGTFLLFLMQYIQKHIAKNRNSISAGDSDVEDFIKREMSGDNSYKWVKDYVFGIDKEASLATAAQINMILHGDGSTNIFSADGLDNFSNYSTSTRAVTIFQNAKKKGNATYSHKVIEAFDIIISNPPFNVKVDKKGFEERFDVKGKSEAFFLERWYQLLKPGGRLGVVLPESFFSVGSDVSAREFLYRHFNVKAIVSLPDFAFKPHTNTLTSLLFAQKKTMQEEIDFAKKFETFSKDFDKKSNSIKAFIQKQFSAAKKPEKDSVPSNDIRQRLLDIALQINTLFGKGFVLLPFFSDSFISDASNFSHITKSIVSSVESVKTRWVISKINSSNDNHFFNVSVDEVGYKAGKKGSKDRPNELLGIFDSNGERIFNLKYCHEWEKINAKTQDTVLAALKGKIKWQ